MLVEIQMFIFYVLIFFFFFYHDCIFINFYSNAAHKFPVYGTIKFYCIVLYCIVYYVYNEMDLVVHDSLVKLSSDFYDTKPIESAK